MNLIDYAKRKASGTVKINAIGDGRAIVISDRFHGGTGDQLPSESEEVHIKALDEQIEGLKKEIQNHQSLLTEMEAFKADLTAADKNFGTGQEIIGKSPSRGRKK